MKPRIATASVVAAASLLAAGALGVRTSPVAAGGPAVASVAHADADKGWTLAADGGVEPYGGAGHHGSLRGRHLNRAAVGIAPTPSGGGYWIVAADGGVFTFGDAPYLGSMGAERLNGPIVGMAPTRSGRGYWLVAADGGTFTFGDGAYHGSHGGRPLAAPVVGMMARPQGDGYWLVARDGGVFSFGAAAFHGSAGSMSLAAPVIGAIATDDGAGYWLAGADGGVFTYGTARFRGAAPSPADPAVALRRASADGYTLVRRSGATSTYPQTTGVTTTSVQTTSTSRPAPNGREAIRRALYAWYDDERAARGLPSIARHADLEAKAQEWVDDPAFASAGHEDDDTWAASPHTRGFGFYGEGSTRQGAGTTAGAAHTAMFGSDHHRGLFFPASARPETVFVGIGVRCHARGLDVVLDVAQLMQDRPGEPNGGNDLDFPSDSPLEPNVHRSGIEGPSC